MRKKDLVIPDGWLIKNLIADMGYDQSPFAKRAGVGERTLDKVVASKPVERSTLAAVSAALGKSVNDLLLSVDSYTKQFRRPTDDWTVDQFEKEYITIKAFDPPVRVVQRHWTIGDVVKLVKTLLPDDTDFHVLQIGGEFLYMACPDTNDNAKALRLLQEPYFQSYVGLGFSIHRPKPD